MPIHVELYFLAARSIPVIRDGNVLPGVGRYDLSGVVRSEGRRAAVSNEDEHAPIAFDQQIVAVIVGIEIGNDHRRAGEAGRIYPNVDCKSNRKVNTPRVDVVVASIELESVLHFA